MTVAHAGRAWAGRGRRPVRGPHRLLSQEPGAHTLSPELLLGRVREDLRELQSGRKACLSTVEELPPEGGKESCGQTLTRGPGGTQVSRTNIAHLFLLTAETSKLMN